MPSLASKLRECWAGSVVRWCECQWSNPAQYLVVVNTMRYIAPGIAKFPSLPEDQLKARTSSLHTTYTSLSQSRSSSPNMHALRRVQYHRNWIWYLNTKVHHMGSMMNIVRRDWVQTGTVHGCSASTVGSTRSWQIGASGENISYAKI